MTGVITWADRNVRSALSIIIALLLIAGLVAWRADDGDDRLQAGSAPAAAGDRSDVDGVSAAAPDGTVAATDGSDPSMSTETAEGTGEAPAIATAGRADRGSRASGAATARPAGTSGAAAAGTTRAGPATPVPGVTDDEITVAYYWKGDRTRTSPFLAGSGMEGNVDEAESFRKLVEYINRHADGGATLMGQPINLHGRKLKPVVVEAGDDAEDYAATATRITEEIKPFAAVAAHGSISTYLCPTLAARGIHNIATYDLAGGLAASTGGYCLPSGLPWEQQVELTEGYLLQAQKSDRGLAVGVVYAEYPGLVDSAPKMVERLERAGVNVVAVASLSASLTTAQQQAGNVVGRMRAAGANTIVMPDAGAPLSFTHAAQAQGYTPDYYVWPCSGQDTMGMVRLLNSSQWARAEGLTCYDESFTSDLTMTGAMRQTEWYRAYREVAPGEEPPAPTPFVYAALLPLVAGLEGAGRELTLESFRAGLDGFAPYRYDAKIGRGDRPVNLLLGLRVPSRALITDAIRLKYNPTRQEPGAPAPGSYDFPEARRYASRADFAA